MDNNLTNLQAFMAMDCFLKKYYKRTESEDIGSLLGDIQLLQQTKTADPAAWDDWLVCVAEIKNLKH